MTPVDWAIANRHRISTQIGTETMTVDPVTWAYSKGLNIDGIDPTKWFGKKSTEYRKKTSYSMTMPMLHELRLNELDKELTQAIDNLDTGKPTDAKALNKLIEEAKSLRSDVTSTAEKEYALGPKSKFYQLVMSGNEKAVARLLDNVSTRHDPKKPGGTTISAEVLVKHSPPELLLKLHEIAQKVEIRRSGKVSGFKDGINKFANGITRVASVGTAGIGDKNVSEALNELENLRASNQSAEKGENTKRSALKQSSFVQSLLSEDEPRRSR